MEDAVKIFRMVATEFETLDDDTVKSWVDLTAPLISQKVFGKLYAQALALLTAHRLKMAGQQPVWNCGRFPENRQLHGGKHFD